MGSSVQRFNYRELKIIEQVMKVMEHMVKGLILQREVIDEMQCEFTSVRGIKDVFFIACHLQERHMTANKAAI